MDTPVSPLPLAVRTANGDVNEANELNNNNNNDGRRTADDGPTTLRKKNRRRH